jgi:hypothetical protein
MGVTDFPCMAVGVHGLQEHELDSPSYFNTLEASKVRRCYE